MSSCTDLLVVAVHACRGDGLPLDLRESACAHGLFRQEDPKRRQPVAALLPVRAVHARVHDDGLNGVVRVESDFPPRLELAPGARAQLGGRAAEPAGDGHCRDLTVDGGGLGRDPAHRQVAVLDLRDLPRVDKRQELDVVLDGVLGSRRLVVGLQRLGELALPARLGAEQLRNTHGVNRGKRRNNTHGVNRGKRRTCSPRVRNSSPPLISYLLAELAQRDLFVQEARRRILLARVFHAPMRL